MALTRPPHPPHNNPLTHSNVTNYLEYIPVEGKTRSHGACSREWIRDNFDQTVMIYDKANVKYKYSKAYSNQPKNIVFINVKPNKLENHKWVYSFRKN